MRRFSISSQTFLDIDPRSSQHNGWDHPQDIVEIDVIVIIQVTNLLWCFGKSQVLQTYSRIVH